MTLTKRNNGATVSSVQNQSNLTTTTPFEADDSDEVLQGNHFRKDFNWVGSDEPHASRRKLILQKHPEIKSLYGVEPLTAVVVVGLVSLQLTMAYLLRASSFWVILPLAYLISGTANHCLNMAVHELSHCLAFKTRSWNAYLGILANIPTAIPSAVTFKRYHLEHHTAQGVATVDMDLPTNFEGKYVRGRILKAIWLFCMPLVYSLRPMIIKPKPAIDIEIVNRIIIITSDLLILYFWGLRSLAYLFFGLYLGSSFHPLAAHFIAEHFEFTEGFETYSYYGPLNFFMLNVGYHNEHHDFPYVPWTRLHKIREMAPEFYDNLPQCKSWVGCMIDFVFDDRINLFNRIKRHSRQSRAEDSGISSDENTSNTPEPLD